MKCGSMRMNKLFIFFLFSYFCTEIGFSGGKIEQIETSETSTGVFSDEQVSSKLCNKKSFWSDF